MIKIMKYGQVPSSEIFARVTPTVDVAGIVADILQDVRKKRRQGGACLLRQV